MQTDFLSFFCAIPTSRGVGALASIPMQVMRLFEIFVVFYIGLTSKSWKLKTALAKFTSWQESHGALWLNVLSVSLAPPHSRSSLNHRKLSITHVARTGQHA